MIVARRPSKIVLSSVPLSFSMTPGRFTLLDFLSACVIDSRGRSDVAAF